MDQNNTESWKDKIRYSEDARFISSKMGDVAIEHFIETCEEVLSQQREAIRAEIEGLSTYIRENRVVVSRDDLLSLPSLNLNETQKEEAKTTE
jgi:hypothetical protein